MSGHRDTRRAALQVLYQYDCGNLDEADVRASLEEAPGGDDALEAGLILAAAAWDRRDETDAAVAALAPDWPTHRQPIVDRSILRLAWHEMATGTTPPKVAINEAIELAREFSTERSPAFVNGVLDKLMRSMSDAAGDESPAADGAGEAPDRDTPIIPGTETDTPLQDAPRSTPAEAADGAE